jgi:hypothetical protein
LRALGHDVVLLPPQHVKPYVKRSKSDAADAEAICESMRRPSMRFVPVKSTGQQAVQMLAKLRAQFIGRRTQLANSIRGFAAELGRVAPRGFPGSAICWLTSASTRRSQTWPGRCSRPWHAIMPDRRGDCRTRWQASGASSARGRHPGLVRDLCTREG